MFAAGLFAGRRLARQAVRLRRRARRRALARARGLAGLAAGGRGAARARRARARRRADHRRRPCCTARSPGFHDWWFAIADYRLSVESVATGSALGAPLAAHRLAAHGRPGRGRALRPRAPRPLAGAAPSRDGADRALVRALADGLRARRPLPRPLLRRAADAAVRARGARARGAAAARWRWRSALAILVLPVYKAWPSYTADGTRERSLASSSDSRIVNDGAVGRYLHAHTDAGRHDLRDVRRRRPLPGLRAPLALSVPLVPRHPAHPRRAAASARHARGPGGAALHRCLPAAAHDRQERPARQRRQHPTAATATSRRSRASRSGACVPSSALGAWPQVRGPARPSSCRARGGRARARRTASSSAGRPRRGRCAGCARPPCSAARSRSDRRRPGVTITKCAPVTYSNS